MCVRAVENVRVDIACDVRGVRVRVWRAGDAIVNGCDHTPKKGLAAVGTRVRLRAQNDVFHVCAMCASDVINVCMLSECVI